MIKIIYDMPHICSHLKTSQCGNIFKNMAKRGKGIMQLTWKYFEDAARMTLWALKSFPSADSMTSVRSPFCLNCPTDSTNWKAWLGQSIMVVAYCMQFDGKLPKSFLVHRYTSNYPICVFLLRFRPPWHRKLQYCNVSLCWELWCGCYTASCGR